MRAEIETRGPAAAARPGSRILTPDQRLRVFVSSTLEELSAERVAASEAIASLGLTPVLFELGARAHPPQTLYRSYLEQSQVFVGIYWQSYGWIAPAADISGLEDEYRLSTGMPRLIYVKEPAEQREPRLKALLEHLRDEGGVSYKEFESSEELRELVSRDLALLIAERFSLSDEFPETVPRSPALPAQSTSFVGRRDELIEIRRHLSGGEVRLLTLTGPGGIGKTRLALEAAERSRGTYPDGVAFVPLDGLGAAELVPAAIAGALGISDLSVEPAERLVAHLRRRRMLLLLDNFEHVMSSAPLVAKLLEAAPRLTIVVTSRELLRLRGEHELRVAPLRLESDAARLFAERAAAARHGFELRPEDVPAVTEICRCLDGVPLAIELAAPRLRLVTPEQLLEQLRERFTFAGPRDAPARQRTLQAAIAWSYGLLDPEERRLFERLGVFHGSFTIEAAEQVAAIDDDSSLLDLLSSLLDKSIVHRLPHGGETRFSMLRMIREYALERLADAGDLGPTAERVAGYYLELACRAEEGLRSPSQRQWRQTLDLEADNFRAVLAWAVERERPGDVSLLLRGLWLWFWQRGNIEELSDWVGRGLACTDRIEVRDRGWLLALGGAFSVLMGKFEDGAAELANAEALLAEAGDRRGVATTKLVSSFGAAPLEGEECAQARLAETLTLFEDLDDLWGIGTTLHAMCRLRIVYDHYDGAGDLFDCALAAVECAGDDLGIALALHNLANAHLAAGDTEEARRVVRRLLEQVRSVGINFAGDDLIEFLARLEHASGEDEPAIELLAAADLLRSQLHTPLWGPYLLRHEQLLDELRAAVGDERFEAAFARGESLDEAAIQATATRLTAGVAPGSPPRLGSPTS